MESERSNPNPYFLPELLIEVLLRLPVKSLVRFVSVSKTWHSLIKDSTFIRQKINLSHENAADKQRLLVRRLVLGEPEPTLSLHEDNENFCQNYVDLEIPPPLLAEQKKRPAETIWTKPYVCDGEVLCLLHMDSFILWNPSINKTIMVPHHCKNETILGQNPFSYEFWSIFGYGFGFDAKANDYKVLRLGSPRFTRSPLKRAQVLSLRDGYWRDIAGESPQCPFASKSINLNGFIYWIATYDDNGKDRNWILTFDLGDEEFGKIAFPDILAYQGARPFDFVVFERAISLFHNDNNDMCSLWVMKKKDVWTKMWSHRPAIAMPFLGYRLNGEILMLDDPYSYNGELFSLNLKTQNRRSLGIRGCNFEVDAYVESLALFDY